MTKIERLIGTTEVVPCYKAHAERVFQQPVKPDRKHKRGLFGTSKLVPCYEASGRKRLSPANPDIETEINQLFVTRYFVTSVIFLCKPWQSR